MLEPIQILFASDSDPQLTLPWLQDVMQLHHSEIEHRRVDYAENFSCPGMTQRLLNVAIQGDHAQVKVKFPCFPCV